MDRSIRVVIRPTILALLVAAALLIIGTDPRPAIRFAPSAGASAIAVASATAAPVAASPSATPRGKEIYKGHTLEEIRADPSLLAEVLAQADYIRPIHPGPSEGAGSALSTARFTLMEISGSSCQSSFEGQSALTQDDFERIAQGAGPAGGVSPDRRGWVGSLADARRHFGGPSFVAEGQGEHWFITRDPSTLAVLGSATGPVAAALIEVPLADGRTLWYLGPRWWAARPC